jgi:crotonobetainyl-CoA:carnitine CoA-transferase CaiB-like acyl-CoA transferase
VSAQGSSGADDQRGTTPESAAAVPLSGLVVLDLTLARAGPVCVRHLADWGADVIRVQPPDTGGEELLGRRDGSDYQNLHRNKRVMALDLKHAEGRAAFVKLVARADVLVENMRAPVKHRLKIAWDDLEPINPRLVYGSISGFGQTGPYAARAAVDQIAQGMGGMMSVTGEAGRGPMRAGIAVSDMSAGTLLALGIMIALFERARTGRGRWVSTSLLESQIFMLDFLAAGYLDSGKVPHQVGNEHATAVPTSVFPTEDGHVNIAASSPQQWRHLAECLDRPDWLAETEWSTLRGRSRDRNALHAAIAVETAKRPTAYWVDRLDAVGVPCGPIYDLAQVFDDPQVKHLGVAASVPHPTAGTRRLVASPLNFAGVDKSLRTAAEITSVHTREVLAWLGYSEAEIAALQENGVTRRQPVRE